MDKVPHPLSLLKQLFRTPCSNTMNFFFAFVPNSAPPLPPPHHNPWTVLLLQIFWTKIWIYLFKSWNFSGFSFRNNGFVGSLRAVFCNLCYAVLPENLCWFSRRRKYTLKAKCLYPYLCLLTFASLKQIFGC